MNIVNVAAQMETDDFIAFDLCDLSQRSRYYETNPFGVAKNVTFFRREGDL